MRSAARQAGLNDRRERGGYVTQGRPPPAGDRAADASAVRRGLLAARSTRVCARSPRPPRAVRRRRGEIGDDEPLPPLQVQFAGGHRIAVETEAMVQAREHLEHRRIAVVILPLLYFVFRSLWLVTVGSLPVRPVAGVRARRDLASRARRCRRPPRAPRPCCSASASTASCCSTSPIAGGRRRRAADIPAALGRTVEQHAARHVDDGRHVLRPDVRRLSEPAAARTAPRPQHGRVRRADARPGAGAAASSRATARRARTADAAACGVDRETAARRARRQRRASRACSGGRRRASTSTRRSIACGR